ncbi:RND transporter [candidate division LCP-89 bacterium B3_LCP]|uniref:RND transporter n=1 Tax=candidate division LCP-89 bacterium B3_LCP TaxID=2012998 RepID=A0A532UVY4_UNCL8|nr:MAG: RND transporter [candidate division LCP-89 bacterium B3_LCP]
MKSIADFTVKFRWLIILSFIILTVIFALQLPKTKIDSDIKNQLPEDMPSRIVTDQIDELFGGTDMAMLMIETDDVLKSETLQRTKALSKKMKRIKGVNKVLSLFELKSIKGEDGAMIVNPAVKRIPTSAKQREKLRNEIKENDIVYGSVVSFDFTATAVIGLLDPDVDDIRIVAELQRIINETPGKEKITMGGMPFTRVNISKDIRGDMRRLMPLGLLIMLIFLFISFRQLRGVLLPFIVVVMSVIFALSLIPLLGWKIMVMTVVLPVMLLAIANDYGIHLIARYQEENFVGNDVTKEKLVKSVIRSLAKPIALTGLTTIAGMLCLLGHTMVPAWQLGVLAAMGIAYALSASLLFIPAVLAVIPKAKPILQGENQEGKVRFLERLLISMGSLVSRWPKQIIVISLIVTVLTALGAFRVEIDTNPSNYYSGGSPVVYANDLANEKFGGSTNISVVLKGDIKQPELMDKIHNLEKKLEELPEVGNTVSIARVVRQMSRALNDEDESGYDQIPQSRNAVAQYFELYSMSGDPDDFEKLVDFPYEHAQVTARIREVSTKQINRVVDYVSELTQDDENVQLVGGFATILRELAELVVRGQIISLISAVIIVGLLIALVFRSPTAGLVSAIPLAISMTILFGLMGFFGIELNVATALLSSIMIGVGIDYTIHFLWRYREEKRSGLRSPEAVKKTLTTTGRGIVFNALSVIIGFSALLVSNFLPVRFFGFLVVVSISSCLVGALVLIPALCIVFKPKFLEANNK